ncbi:sulfotransferase [Shewanella pealeana]|nr:sulfotransferase [Shewanella pealeana]
MNKVFIIGLPRTGTTSISVAMLDYGFKVAHTAYTQQAFNLADIVSDAPCFSDYQQLDKLFPDAKFVYLERELSLWIPSMQMLINKMKVELDLKTGTFNPVLKRSFNHTFMLDKTDNPDEPAHLEKCYLDHKQQVLHYFADRDDFIRINISHEESLGQLLTFLGLEVDGSPQFPHLNIGRNVACWEEHKHPNKVNANSIGPLRRKFFDYAAKL